MSDYKYIGKPRKLVEGLEKVTGVAQFGADLNLPNMVYAQLVLSPYAHAKILSVDIGGAQAMPGVLGVFRGEDVNPTGRPITSRVNATLARDKVIWRGQPVVAVVATSAQLAADAAEMVVVEYDPLPAIADLAAATHPDSPTVWENGLPKDEEDMADLHGGSADGDAEAVKLPNNVYADNHFSRGDVAQGFSAADIIIERLYKVPAIHQGYLEPHACIAQPDPLNKGLIIYSGNQGQFVVRNGVAAALKMAQHQVKVIPLAMGGSFGSKYGVMEPLAGALAMQMRRPVKLTLTRSEDFLTTMPAGGIHIQLKVGAANSGELTALQATVHLDSGNFSFGISGIVATLLGGYYKCPNAQIDCYEVNTHRPHAGAYRAPGAAHATFAIETVMDELASKLNIDPFTLRLKNAAEEGDLTGTGQPWPPVGIKFCLEQLQAHPAWQNRHKDENEGVGVAIGGWPNAVTPSSAICRVGAEGVVSLHLGSADISGVNSSFVLIAAEILGISPDEVNIIRGDTASNPFAPNAGGSQTTYSVAGAVRAAAKGARDKLLRVAADEFEAAAEDIELADSHAHVKGFPDKRISIYKLAERAQYKRGGEGPIVGEGSSAIAQNAPGFAAQLAKVRVDKETGEVTVLELVTLQDVGFAINPLMVKGQMQGGAAQGLGMALHEALIYDQEGQLLTGSFMDYRLPRAEDVPALETIPLENPSPLGPFGARGVGEPPIIPGIAAISNAIFDAVGVRLTETPFTAERVWQALQAVSVEE